MKGLWGLGAGILAALLTSSVCFAHNAIFSAADTGFRNPYTDAATIEQLLDGMQVHCLIRPYSDANIIRNRQAGHKIVGIRVHSFNDNPNVRIIDLIFDVYDYSENTHLDTGPSSLCDRDE